MAKLKKDERICPFCAETIKAAATKCRYCQSDLPPEPKAAPEPDPAPESQRVAESESAPESQRAGESELAPPGVGAAPTSSSPGPSTLSSPTEMVSARPRFEGDSATFAPMGRRIGAYLLDNALGTFAAFSGPLLATLLIAVTEGSVGIGILAVGYVLVGFWYALYVWHLTATKGYSPAKKLLGLWVVDADTRMPIGYGRVFVRGLVLGAVSLFTFGVGLIVLAVTADSHPRRQGWHDRTVNSIVTTDPPAAEASDFRPSRLQERLTPILAVFVVLAAAGVGVCWWRADHGSPSIDEDARTQVLVSAADLIQRTLSYDYKSLDQDMETATAKMTPGFRKEYRSTMDQVRANTEKNKIVLEAAAVSSAIIDVSETKAKVLVFANQTTTVGTGKAKKQQLLRNSLVVTLERDGGDWVIDKLTALG